MRIKNKQNHTRRMAVTSCRVRNKVTGFQQFHKFSEFHLQSEYVTRHWYLQFFHGNHHPLGIELREMSSLKTKTQSAQNERKLLKYKRGMHVQRIYSRRRWLSRAHNGECWTCTKCSQTRMFTRSQWCACLVLSEDFGYIFMIWVRHSTIQT